MPGAVFDAGGLACLRGWFGGLVGAGFFGTGCVFAGSVFAGFLFPGSVYVGAGVPCPPW